MSRLCAVIFSSHGHSSAGDAPLSARSYQFDKTLSDDLTHRGQSVVGEEGDVFECVLVETDRRLGRERETRQIKVASQFTSFFVHEVRECNLSPC